MRAKVGARHAVAVNSATSALHVACAALGLSNGDLLWTVPNTFVASANCARYCGADVDFVDIDPDTWSLSVRALRDKLEVAKKTGRLPKIVVPVHFAGQPTDQEQIWELAKQYGFRVIEDASHAVGAARNGEPVGSCRWSDITIFSFHPVKIITTAEGGLAFTNDGELARLMAMYRSHGITRDVKRFEQQGEGAWHYEQHLLGYNYRITDVQAALGLSQSTRIDEFVECRNTIARAYDEALRGSSLRLPTIRRENLCTFHLYVVRVPGGRGQRRKVFDALRQRGIGVNVHYMPVHLQPYYRALGFGPGYCPEAEAHGNEAITLPLYPGLSTPDQQAVIDAVRASL